MRRKKRVRLHLKDPGLPSVEGVLLHRRPCEYVVALPKLLIAAGADPAPLDDARVLEIPRENVAFYEVLS